jgi:hypothetical protein
VHTIATLLVFADIAGNATKLKVTIAAFAVCAVIAYLAASILKSDHRGAWAAIPLVIMVLILASQGGANALRNGGMQVWNLLFG